MKILGVITSNPRELSQVAFAYFDHNTQNEITKLLQDKKNVEILRQLRLLIIGNISQSQT